MPGVADGDTSGHADVHFASCAFVGTGPDEVWSFVAPSAGRYSFQAVGPPFRPFLAVDSPIVSVQDTCNRATDLACAVPERPAMVDLAAGQEVFVVVDGSSGAGFAYTLSVTVE